MAITARVQIVQRIQSVLVLFRPNDYISKCLLEKRSLSLSFSLQKTNSANLPGFRLFNFFPFEIQSFKKNKIFQLNTPINFLNQKTLIHRSELREREREFEKATVFAVPNSSSSGSISIYGDSSGDSKSAARCFWPEKFRSESFWPKRRTSSTLFLQAN